MEITDINIITDFEVGVKCLQNPSLISRFFSISDIENVAQLSYLWKWGALIIAVFATFTRLLVNRIKFLIVRIRTVNSSLKPLLDDDNFDFSQDDTSSSEAESDDEEFESTSSFEDQEPVDEDFPVAGSSCFSADEVQNGNTKLRRRHIGRRCFSWSDFTAGKSVVQLWDRYRLGLGLDFEESFGTEISIYDLDKSENISSFHGERCRFPAVDMSSPVLVLSAGMNSSESIVFSAYDKRVGRGIPAINADWGSRLGNVVSICSGGVEKVYITDNVAGGITVGDLRNVKAPLERLTSLPLVRE